MAEKELSQNVTVKNSDHRRIDGSKNKADAERSPPDNSRQGGQVQVYLGDSADKMSHLVSQLKFETRLDTKDPTLAMKLVPQDTRNQSLEDKSTQTEQLVMVNVASIQTEMLDELENVM